MARYFFNVKNGVGDFPDDEGGEFDDLAAVENEATSNALAMARNILKRGDETLIVDVRDASGNQVMKVTVSLNVDTAPSGPPSTADT